MSSSALPPGYAETDIAIVGMSGRFPGASDIETFWKNIRDGVDAGVWLDEEQLRAAGVTDEELADPNYIRVCHPIEDMAGFDAGFFGFSPREAAIMDPQQRHFLEVAWEAMEHAGHDPSREAGKVGVFAGCGASLYLMRNLLTRRELVDGVGFFLLRHTGNDKDFLATRVSYLMNLSGPSVNVQTACSTSLVAIHLACQSLLAAECDMAIAGGSTLKQPHRVGYTYQEGEILSPDGKCRTFDAKAEGTVFGSGAGAIILRRLEDAIRDGDTIHAVIKGSSVNNDGSSKVGFLAPSVDGQAVNMAEALAISGVNAAELGYVECHGTATPVGDPIEVAALTQAFSNTSAAKGSIAIGSVKTNVGHLDTAAGVAGLIKTVQALKHAQLPPSLHYESPNPAMDLESGPFYVNAELRSWPSRGAHRLAAVTALGAGGTNAHIVLQSAPVPVASAASPVGRRWQLLPISTKTQSALDRQTDRIADYLNRDGVSLNDTAFTLQRGRQAFQWRRFVVADSVQGAQELLRAKDPKSAPVTSVPSARRSVAFMFAGGGAQYPAMGQDLYEQEPVYRAAVDECVALLQPRLDWSLKGLLYPPVDGRETAATEMQRPSRSLPCLFTTQYAMAKLLMSWGIAPDAMLGHSMGEYTAAHLAGVFSLDDALALVAFRGKLFETVPRGGMLSVPLDAADLAKRLPPALSIAAANAPGLSVASGPVDALDALERELLTDDIECTRVHIDIAAHSSMLDVILEEFGAFTAKIRYSAPTKPFVSNVTGTWIKPEEATDPRYWVKHLRQTVQFADGAGTLLADEGRVLVEVGPGKVLATLAGLHGSKTPVHEIMTTMRHPAEERNDVAVALATVGRLWAAGVETDWAAVAGEAPGRRVPLPTYPFEHGQHFFEPGVVSAPAPTLAKRADVGAWAWRPSWEKATIASVSELPADATWLVLHDDAGIGARIAERLRAAGAPVVSVLAGVEYAKRDAATFVVDPASAEQFDRLVADLTASTPLPNRIVHTWAATDGAVGEARAFYSLLSLTQAIGRAGIEEQLRLDVVTTGGQYVGGESQLEPDRALVMGPVRVVPKEFPNITCRAIDLPMPGAPGFHERRAVAQALQELAHGGEEESIAWRGVERYRPSFEEVALPAASDGIHLGDGAVWLITGGLGGLGYLVAEELAKRARVRLVLTGRSATRTAAVAALETLGAEVLVVKADVADEAAMRAAVAEARRAFGPITGVVHAAGLVEDSLVLMKEKESAARVLRPKVQGTQVLEAVTRDEPLERVVYFSSRGAYAGVAGQVDYTAASAYLDACAVRASQLRGVPVISLNWSAWKDVGIAAGGASAGRSTSHPLLDRCVAEADDRAEYRSTLSTKAHWILDGHRLRSGEALIPGTGYVEILGAAAEERGRRGTLELRDVFFIAPFMVRDGATREMRVTVERSGALDEVIVEGRANPAATEWDEHVRATATTVTTAAPSFDAAAVRARCTSRAVTFEGVEQRNANLTLGHRWENLTRIDYGATEALAALQLPADVAAETAQFRLHPALLDVACACAQELVPGFDTATQFFIPVSYGRITVFGDLPPQCLSHIRLRPGAGPEADTAVYDITIVAPDGRVVVDIGDFTMMRVREGTGVASTSASDAADAHQLPHVDTAMAPAEGLDFLARVLRSGLDGQLVVSPQHLPTYLESLRHPPEVPGAREGERPSAPALDLVDASEVEMVLATNEAIADVVVLAHKAASGEIKSTAFIVWELGEQLTIAELRRFLKGSVPEDLVPQQLVEMDVFPTDAAGDVDRAALPDPFAPKDDYVGPSTEMERLIAGIWKELLGVSRVSVHDNFLDVGGHSLLAMRAVSRIAKATGVRLNPSVMTLNTLSQIAAECEGAVGAAS